MCGRYTQTRGPQWLVKEFECAEEGVSIEPRYNIAPTQPAIVVTCRGSRRFQSLRWGLEISTLQGPLNGRSLVNVRAESLVSKPVFQPFFQQQRCLVPADGYFEWKKTENRKQPFRFVLKEDALFAFAGIWNAAAPGGFAIVTTEASDAVKPIHSRMPLILTRPQYTAWLRPEPMEASEVVALVQAVHKVALRSYPVNPVVNRVGCDSPSCVQPCIVEETGWLF